MEREVVHVALGDSAACHVSAHWLNLEGLAGTSGVDNNTSSTICSPGTTHFQHEKVYVPRAVLVGRGGYVSSGEYDRAVSTSTATSTAQAQQQQPEAAPLFFPTWKGAVETVQVAPTQGHNYSSNSGEYRGPSPASAQFQSVATDLAYSSYSRYRVPSQHQEPHQSYASKGRHVNWDDEGEEEEEDDWEERNFREQQRQQAWQKQYRPAQDALEDFWNNGAGVVDARLSSSGGPTETAAPAAPSSSSQEVKPAAATPMRAPSQQGVWKDYLMPPFHPNTCLDAPRTDAFNKEGDATQSYYTAVSGDSEWIETVLWERIRKMLEDCDACQGLMLVQESNSSGVFAGWGTALLREWHDECPNTCQWVIDIRQDENETEDALGNDVEASSGTEPNASSATSRNKRQQAKIRNQVHQALALSDQSELADVYLPLQLPSNNTAGAAAVAAALESVTLPYRLTGGNNNRSQLALQSYYSGSFTGGCPFGSAPNLSYREFVRSLRRQSASRNVLELDAILPWKLPSRTDGSSLYSRLQQGTSLERDQRIRQPGYGGGIHRPRDVLPGEWMMDSSSNANGLLASLSPTATLDSPRNSDRSLHHHYSLSTSLRPTVRTAEASTSNYIASIMEGMGIRYRPEQSMATVVDQSLAQLTADGYGAGSYWKSIFAGGNPSAENAQPKTSLQAVPVLAVLGNTTRIYPYLYQTASTAQQVIAPRNKRSVNRSLYNRDVVAGILPEVDDCEEAVSACLDIRDSYEPPEGSGLVVDEEGTYFDMS